MNKRQIMFLNKLVSHCRKFLPIDYFAEEFKVSPKTLRRDLEIIGEYLKGFGGEIERRSGVGIRLRIGQEQKGQLCSHITYLAWGSRGSGEKTWERESRRMDIGLNLLLDSGEYTSLSSLAYEYYVSKSTIHHDLIVLGGMFAPFGVDITGTARGTMAAGSEHGIRRAMVYLLSYILDARAVLCERGEYESPGLPGPGAFETILDIFREDDISFVNRLLCRIEETYGYRFDDGEFVNVALNFLVMAYRVKNGRTLTMEHSPYVTGLRDLKGIREIGDTVSAQMLEQYGVELPVPEREEIKNIILTTHLFEPWGGNHSSDEVFQLFSEDFIDAFTTITNISLRENPDFCGNVISHINLMLNRLFNGTPASNPLMELLIKDYQSTLNVCRIICCILAKKFQLPELSLDEISFLMLYILGETVRQSHHAKVLFVTELAKSIANLSRLRLQQHFPQWNFTTITPDEYLSVKDGSYDFCISTVILGKRRGSLPYVQVSPILESRDFQNIQELFWRTNESAASYLLELERIVNDLRDIGCIIHFSREDSSDGKDGFIRTAALKGFQYMYSINEQEENHCTFVLDETGTGIRMVHINMSNLDFMLFSSKIVYLLDNCPHDAIPDFIDNL